jgi:hypothetical protein
MRDEGHSGNLPNSERSIGGLLAARGESTMGG